MNNGLALFDFDGTLTTRDSMLEFIAFHYGKRRLRLALAKLAPRLVSMKVRIVPPQAVKERLLKHFFNGKSQAELFELGRAYSEQFLDQIIREEAINKMRWHQERHEVYVVSASCEEWLQAWCEKEQVKLIASKMAYDENGFTGKLNGKNCNGPEKLVRIKQEIDLKQFKTIYAYGDTSGDKEMLGLANNPFYRKF